MKIEDLKINMLIEIEIQNPDQNPERLPSRVEEINNKYLYVSAPMRHGAILPLRFGQEVKVIVFTKQGLFAAGSRVMGIERGAIPILVLGLPQNFSSITQRRHYVRLEIPLKIDCCLPPHPGEEEVDWETGITIDISAGGVFFVSRRPLKSGQIIIIRLYLDDKHSIECQGQVMRSFKDNQHARTYGIGVKFLDITNAQKEQIFQFIFSKQREWIQKGLL